MHFNSYWLDTSALHSGSCDVVAVGGVIDMTANLLPRAGQRDGVYSAMGYSGHGTHMVTLTGTLMAGIMDGRVDLNPWKDFDWLVIPEYFGKPCFLPFVGAWHRLKDILQ
jgi:glycine/D-amino acid oxidase-like deaminating enzyme